MTFLAPIAGLVAAAVALPALVALYFLKLRRRQMVVSSTLLWKRAIQDLQVNAPFQKLRKNLLLLLQLLLLLALLLAFARPTFRGAAQAGQRVVIMIDHSASMNATDESPTRLDRAKELALRLVEDATGGAAEGQAQAAGNVMVVSFGNGARVVQPFTSDVSLLRGAVRSIEPTDGYSRLDAAMRLIDAFAAEVQNNPDASLVVYVLSDGRVHGGERLALRGGEMRYVPIGKPQPANAAVVSMSARRDLSDARQVQVFAQLANFGDEPVSANLTLSMDGNVLRVMPVTIPAAPVAGAPVDGGAGSDPASSNGPAAPGLLPVQFGFELVGSAMLSLGLGYDDALLADNGAAVLVAPPRELRVLLVSPGNAFLERAVESIGVRRMVSMTPAQYEAMDQAQLAGAADGSGGFDVIVFDEYSPKSLPPLDSLYFGAAPPVENLRRVPPAEGTGQAAQVVLDWRRDHPVMNYVVLDDLVMVDAPRLALPDDATVLATGQSGPVMAELSAEGRRHIVAGFSLLKTNWPMQVSFAVFMSNALHSLGWGALGGQGVAFSPGQVAVVPTSAARVEYDGPVELSATPDRGFAVLPMFERVGLYRTGSAVAQPWDRLAVNLTDEVESDLRPAAQLQVGTAPVQGQSATAAVRREVWWWFAWAALAVLLVEWLVFTRRMHL